MIDTNADAQLNAAVESELKNIRKVYGEQYHSLHEGYAILLEEIEEAEKDFDYIKNHCAMLWDNVKINDATTVKANARAIAFDAVELAKEAVQIGAVARKILGEGV